MIIGAGSSVLDYPLDSPFQRLLLELWLPFQGIENLLNFLRHREVRLPARNVTLLCRAPKNGSPHFPFSPRGSTVSGRQTIPTCLLFSNSCLQTFSFAKASSGTAPGCVPGITTHNTHAHWANAGLVPATRMSRATSNVFIVPARLPLRIGGEIGVNELVHQIAYPLSY